MLSRLKRPSGLLFLFFVVLSMSIFFLSVRQLRGEDSGVSGGAEGSTSVVTGTNDICKEEGQSTKECITHVCTEFEEYKSEPFSSCEIASRYISPEEKKIYCVGQSVSYKLEMSGEDKIGKKLVYYRCIECKKDRVDNNPQTQSHSTEYFPPPVFKWEAGDNGVSQTSGDGTSASFNVDTVSSSVGSSYVKFFPAPDKFCKCKESPSCSLNIGSFYKSFTVVKLDKVEVESGATNIDDGTATPANTDICATIKEPGDVVLKAVLKPNISEGNIPAGLVTWTGGQEMPGQPLHRKILKSNWAKHTVTATCTNTYTMLAYVIGAEQSGYSPKDGQSGSHFSDNSVGYSSTGIFEPDETTGYSESHCEIEFTVKPNDLVTDGNANLFKKDHIQWDVSRDKRVMVWRKTGDSWSLVDDRSASWESDDETDEDEDNNPWDGKGHIYGNDATKTRFFFQAVVKKMNAREWVRVGLGGVTGRNGSRCSGYYEWHGFRSLEKKDETWVADDTYGNEISSGNIFWGTVPVK